MSQQLSQKTCIVEESQIIKHLNILFGNSPVLCQKEKVSGFGSNERVIIVRNQHFEFYNVPKKFVSRSPDSIQLLKDQDCKGRVDLRDIYQLSYLPFGNKKRKILELMIPFNKLQLKNEAIYKSTLKTDPIQNQQNLNKQLIRWKFQFKFDTRAYVRESLQQKIRVRKKTQIHVQIDPNKDLSQGILNLSTVQKQQKFHNSSDFYSDQYDPEKILDQNVQKLNKLKDFTRMKNKVEQKQNKRLQTIKNNLQMIGGSRDQQNEQDLNIYPIRYYWRDYHSAYQLVQKSHQSFNEQVPTKQLLDRQFNFLLQIKKFEQQAKNIIESYINQKLIGWKAQRIKYYDFQFYNGVWIKIGGKQLNYQFMTANILADLFLVAQEIKGFNFRIPLTVFAKYKSMKVLCMSDMPFSINKKLQEEVYNLKKSSRQLDIELINRMKESFKYIQKIINIKSEDYHSERFSTEAPLGHQIKAYKYDNNHDHMENLVYISNFYYLTGIKDLFPLDYNYQQHGKFNPEYRLRPELISEWRDIRQQNFQQNNQLLSQAFKLSEIDVNFKQSQDDKIVDISDSFFTKKVYELIEKLQQIDIILIDSYTIKEYMSVMGINSRYLGLLYRLSTCQYLKETFMIQMIGRTIKNLYRETVADMVNQDRLIKRKLIQIDKTNNLVNDIIQHDNAMKHCAIDFLNLIFGKGGQTEQFWEIIKVKCKDKYDVKCYETSEIKPGCLLLTIIWHIGISINYSPEIKFFDVEKPFSMKNWKSFQTKIKTFDFPSLKTNKIIKKLALVQGNLQGLNQTEQLIFPLLKFQLNNYVKRYGFGHQTQIILSRINNMGESYQKPLTQSEYHPSLLSYYITNKSTENFKKAIDIIHFSLVDNHPLFISLYDCYASYFENELLKKSALLAAIKGLGEFHPRTTQIYSKYYREGDIQYQIKATRSETTEAALILSNQLFQKRKYQSCLQFTQNRIMKKKKISLKAGSEIQMYIKILRNGLSSALSVQNYKTASNIVEQYSDLVNIYKIRKFEDHHFLLEKSLIIQLNISDKKYYLYKMVLLVLKIQQKYQPKFMNPENKFQPPRSTEECDKILHEIMNQYYLKDTHLKWIEDILKRLIVGYLYFNNLNDLFNNFQYHINNYGMENFKTALGYLDTMVKYFGQKLFHDYLYEVN